LMIVSLFSHTLLDEPPILLVLALVATMGAAKPGGVSESERGWGGTASSGLTSPTDSVSSNM
jgi:hypothetical protein